MVRIAGIDKDFTPLELLFYQEDDQTKLHLVSSYLANFTKEHGGLELTVTLDDDSVVKINTKIKKGKKK